MTNARVVFARYLRQRQELGESELILDRSVVDSLLAAPTAEPGAASPQARPIAPSLNIDSTPQRIRFEPVALVTLGSLDALASVAKGCTACGLAATRTNVVFSDGDPNAKLVVVGEAPGADEDRAGRPFVGRAGRMLDTLLAAVGFPRETVYICNVLKCRPPGNRNPLPEEVHSCEGFLRAQLQMVGPKAILAVGTFAAQTLLETTQSIGTLRGSVHEYQGIPLVPTYHPAALLRNSAWIRPVWEDLQRLRVALDRQLA
jgi:uracil-DNA glycosylase family 4